MSTTPPSDAEITAVIDGLEYLAEGFVHLSNRETCTAAARLLRSLQERVKELEGQLGLRGNEDVV